MLRLTQAPLSMLVLLILTLYASVAISVKRQDFKTCSQSGFCRRTRALAETAEKYRKEWKSPYGIADASMLADGTFTGKIRNNVYPHVSFSLQIRLHDDGTARVLVDEIDGLRQRYNEAASWAVIGDPILADPSTISANISTRHTNIVYFNKQHELHIQHDPILLTFYRNGQPHITLNQDGLFNMEHFRNKVIDAPDNAPDNADKVNAEGGPEMLIQEPGKTAPGINTQYPHFPVGDVDGMWEESFGGHKDTKPKGPEALSMDITFLGYEHVYGIPQHPGPLSLRTTKGGKDAYTDPYRLYNTDIFEYLADSEMATYGAIPYMNAHRAGSSVAVFWLSGSETWIDITKATTPKYATDSWRKNRTRNKAKETGNNDDDLGPGKMTTSTHWMSESGILDLFVFLGPTPNDLQSQYSKLTGTTSLPQYFGIANHQCRWNYQSQEDVVEVSRRFSEANIPLDVIWLDIEYAHEHEYFIWDRRYFPEPEEMQKKLANDGRQLVAIIDPHIKKDDNLYVYAEAQTLGILSKTHEGKEYEGWCWTGSSAWVDFFNPTSWKWWIGLFKFNKFKGSSPNLWIWNDMNEPAIFNGPEVSMPRDNLHHNGWEHRDIHNINGILFHNLTARALIERESTYRRPFVLSRSFYAGSQQFGPTWHGDNLGTWDHLAASIPLTLSNGVAGMAWTGADVAGFFGNPSEEMLVRWYQAGVFYPFFRAHAHIDTKRREPYLFKEPVRGYLREAINLRYSLLPLWYTAFWHSHLYGVPIAKPQYVVFPLDEAGFAIDDQYYIGDSGLLVKPVVKEGQTEVQVYLSDTEPYYNYFNHDIYRSPSGSRGGSVNVPAPLDTIPLLQRGGTILTKRDIIRRSSTLMLPDPISLVIALDSSGQLAKGELYLDDGDSFQYKKNAFMWRNFELNSDGTDAHGSKSLRNSLHRSSSEANTINSQFYDDLWTSGKGSLSDIPMVGNLTDFSKMQLRKDLGKIADVKIQQVTILGLKHAPTCVKHADAEVGYEFEWSGGAAFDSKQQKSKQAASKLVISNLDLEVIDDWDVTMYFDEGKRCHYSQNRPQFLQDLISSGCSANEFKCENNGHISSCIPISRVNDGLCEPECCDGSDEIDGRANCPNVCKAANQEYLAEEAHKDNELKAGATVRDEYIIHGQNEKKHIQDNVQRLNKELKGAEVREEQLKRVLDLAEEQGAEDIARKKSTTLYQKVVKYQEAVKSLRLERSELDDEIEKLSNILTELKEGYNPNYQDMAVLGAVRNFDKWLQESDAKDPKNTEENSPQRSENNVKEYLSDTDLISMENEDALALMNEIDFSSFENEETLLFKAEAYIPEQFKAYFESFTNRLVDILSRSGIIKRGAHVSSGKESAEVNRARDAHRAAVKEVNSVKSKRNKEQGALEKDWGTEWEFKKLDGVCVEKPFGEYIYELCFFGQGKQKDQKGRSTTLGRFSSWSPDSESGNDEYYTKQMYNNGQSCWNGPQRSIKVNLICGSRNELLSISEPEKCEYYFKASTPALCKL